jgi:hypothetical protein
MEEMNGDTEDGGETMVEAVEAPEATGVEGATVEVIEVGEVVEEGGVDQGGDQHVTGILVGLKDEDIPEELRAVAVALQQKITAAEESGAFGGQPFNPRRASTQRIIDDESEETGVSGADQKLNEEYRAFHATVVILRDRAEQVAAGVSDGELNYSLGIKMNEVRKKTSDQIMNIVCDHLGVALKKDPKMLHENEKWYVEIEYQRKNEWYLKK